MMETLPRTRTKLPGPAAAAFLIALIPFALLVYRFNWLVDDAFISFRYAQNLIGIYLVTFQVPLDATPGASIPLTVGVTTSDGQTITSRPSRIPISQ